jgi:NADPH2:quinone reductase
MTTMKAIVISSYGEPGVLREQDVPMPTVTPGTVIVRVRAFGLNHAECYFRRGIWGDVAKISGIECAGEIHDAGASGLRTGQRVIALMGGMGRSIDGSYAEYVRVPVAHVIAVETPLGWEELAALPESYATAWTFLEKNLEVRSGQTLFVRGGTSALGQAAIDIARARDVRVLASSRTREKLSILERLGAEPVLDTGALAGELPSVDAVLDIIGTTTIYDSLRLARYGGRVALAGFLGGGGAIPFDPLQHLPNGVQLSFFASASGFGSAVPLASIPFAELIASARCRPAHVYDVGDIVAAHRLMESGQARGKIVVRGYA